MTRRRRRSARQDLGQDLVLAVATSRVGPPGRRIGRRTGRTPAPTEIPAKRRSRQVHEARPLLTQLGDDLGAIVIEDIADDDSGALLDDCSGGRPAGQSPELVEAALPSVRSRQHSERTELDEQRHADQPIQVKARPEWANVHGVEPHLPGQSADDPLGLWVVPSEQD